MESTVEVALAAKILKLFPPGEDKYLSFPMTGLAFTRDDLDFLGDDEGLSASQLREKMTRKAQFARLMNLIPNDSLVYSTVNSLLWSEYARILEDAELAESLLTAEETKKLARADAFLGEERVVDGILTRVYSPALEKYYEYKEAYQEIERVYLDEELTATTTENPEEKRAWETKRKPDLTDLKARAFADWQLLGHKDEVEEHQRVKMHLSGKIPRRYVIDYMNDLQVCKEPDLLTNDPIGTFSTFYSPSDTFLPSADWSRINLTKSEVQSLVRDAPSELKRFASQPADDIESLTIEYAKVVVMRPWFNQDLFSSRYWRLPQGATVSDGAIPRSGRIPAFVTNVVVARKIAIERLKPKSQPTTPRAATPEAFKALPLMAAALKHVNQSWKITTGKNVKTHKRAATILQPQAIARPQPRTAPAPRIAVRSAVGMRAMAAVTRAPTPAIHAAFLRSKVQGTTVRRLAMAMPPKQPAKPAPPPPDRFERVIEEVALDGVAVLAFVCRRVPKCPDPDTGLSWD